MSEPVPAPVLPQPDSSGLLGDLISPDSPPLGAQRIVVRPRHGDPVGFLGRVVARGLPCTVPSDKGPGCGGIDRTLLVRFPATGRNLPGENNVGQAQFCPECGVADVYVTATAQEMQWGWVTHIAV